MVELVKTFGDKSYLFVKRGVYFRLSLEEAEQITRMINEEIQQRGLDKGEVERIHNVSPKKGMAKISSTFPGNERSMGKKRGI